MRTPTRSRHLAQTPARRPAVRPARRRSRAQSGETPRAVEALQRAHPDGKLARSLGQVEDRPPRRAAPRRAAPRRGTDRCADLPRPQLESRPCARERTQPSSIARVGNARRCVWFAPERADVGRIPCWSLTDGVPVRSMKQLFELALQLEPPWRVLSSDFDFDANESICAWVSGPVRGSPARNAAAPAKPLSSPRARGASRT
jgi:hypothetical protein